jgi:hypothetical protein
MTILPNYRKFVEFLKLNNSTSYVEQIFINCGVHILICTHRDIELYFIGALQMQVDCILCIEKTKKIEGLWFGNTVAVSGIILKIRTSISAIPSLY